MTDLILQPSIAISHARAELAALALATTKIPNNMHILTLNADACALATLPDKKANKNIQTANHPLHN